MTSKTNVKTKTDLALEFGRAMNELRNHVRQFIQVKIREHNINITFEMLEVMSVLWRKDGINQQELADLTLRDKSSMTYLIDNLTKRGLVKRTEDASDRRNKLIFLTEEGNVLKDQLHPWVAEVYAAAAGDLDAGELKKGLLLVNCMTANLKGE